ncbi:MAG: ABC transporter ATP-binding protein [Anaerolineales bacterium]|jgi:ABC-type uncharacterized transport system ATPase subunit
MSEIVCEVRNITKSFPGVLANDKISFQLRKGEIHAFLGENGAGKSTLMNIIYGLYDPDEGQIFLDGEEVSIENPHDAIARGIGMVHQHFMLVPVFTALENIVLGSETTRGATLDLASARKDVLEISERYGLPIDPDMVIEDMPVGLQQRVEIIKALYRKADILVLDEPTAVLTPQEADDLFVVMRSLAEQGKSIIFITHKLREILAVADTISVIRRGKLVGSATPEEANRAMLASMMVGRDVVLQVDKTPAQPGETVLDVQNLTVIDERNQVALDEVSFEVRAGEILGVAGVQGNGQTELVEALTGLRPIEHGQFNLLGKSFGEKKDYRNRLEEFVDAKIYQRAMNIAIGVLLVDIVLGWIFNYIEASASFITGVGFLLTVLNILSGIVILPYAAFLLYLLFTNPKELFERKPTDVRRLTELGSGHIPEDRQRDGLVLGYSIAKNLVLNTYYIPPYSKGIIIQEEPIVDRAVDLVEKFDIRTPDALNTAGSLSGGNQQKVIVAREFSRPTKFMLAAQPTRGLDVGSIEYIHKRLIEKRDEGTAVLLVSTELDEIMQLSDRIAVMYDGKIVDILDADKVTKEIVGLLMAGETPHDAWNKN